MKQFSRVWKSTFWVWKKFDFCKKIVSYPRVWKYQLFFPDVNPHCLGPQILSDYAFLHYNYKYDWLRPTLEEIVDAYTKLYGKESRESDIESDGSESSTTEEVEEDGDED